VVAKEGIAGSDRTKNRRQAALLIHDWFGVASEPTPALETSAAAETSTPVEDVTSAEEAPEEGANPPLLFTFKQLDNRHPYLMQNRSLREATTDVFGLGHHAGKGMMGL
jgi:hypothetical protein